MSSRTALATTRLVEWIPALAGMSFVFLLQTLAGGIILGVAPAAAVLAHTVRARVDEMRVGFRESWKLWAASWRRSQLQLGIPLLQLAPLTAWLLITRGSMWVATVAVIGVVLSAWLFVLPPTQTRNPHASASQVWIDALRRLARHPLMISAAIGVVAVLFIALWNWLLVGLIVWGPGLMVLAAELAYRGGERRGTKKAQ
jgi:uncharacterized membrane protein YesL